MFSWMELHARSGCFHILRTRIWNESMWRRHFCFFFIYCIFSFRSSFASLNISDDFFSFFVNVKSEHESKLLPSKTKMERKEEIQNVLLMIKAKLRTFSFYLRYKSHIFAILNRCYALHCLTQSTRGVSRVYMAYGSQSQLRAQHSHCAHLISHRYVSFRVCRHISYFGSENAVVPCAGTASAAWPPCWMHHQWKFITV